MQSADGSFCIIKEHFKTINIDTRASGIQYRGNKQGTHFLASEPTVTKTLLMARRNSSNYNINRRREKSQTASYVKLKIARHSQRHIQTNIASFGNPTKVYKKRIGTRTNDEGIIDKHQSHGFESPNARVRLYLQLNPVLAKTRRRHSSGLEMRKRTFIRNCLEVGENAKLIIA